MTQKTMTVAEKSLTTPLFTRNFLLVSLATLAFFTSNHLLTPSVPIFLEQPGVILAADYGLLLSGFMVASLILRPFVGKWCDEGRTRGFMILGAVLFAFMPLLYPMTVSTPFLMPVRLIHGAAMAFYMTAANTFLSLEIPAERRAEGMSHFGNAIKLAMAFGPGIGLYLASIKAFDLLFYLSALCGLVTLLMVLFLKGQSPAVPAVMQSPSAITRKPSGRLFNVDALFPGIVMATNSIVFGMLIPFAPMLAREKGVGEEIGWFYTLYAFSLIFSRALTGPVSDRYGRDKVIVPGMLGVSFSLLLIGIAFHPSFFMLSAAFYGLCAGTVQPSLMAMVADRVTPEHRGSAMATFTLFTDLGIACGTFLTGHFGPIIGFTNVLYGVLGVTIVGLGYYLVQQRLETRAKARMKVKEGAYA